MIAERDGVGNTSRYLLDVGHELLTNQTIVGSKIVCEVTIVKDHVKVVVSCE